jgi:hypothetical protein
MGFLSHLRIGLLHTLNPYLKKLYLRIYAETYMKKIITQIVVLILISGITFFQTAHVFADETENAPAETQNVSVEPTPQPESETVQETPAPTPTATPDPVLSPSPISAPESGSSTLQDVPALSVADTNDSVSTNTATTEAMTGGNTISDTGTSTIISGDAIAATDIVNVTNTNSINSNVDIAIQNQLSGDDHVHLEDLVGNSTACNCTLSTTSPSLSSLTSSTTNTTDISNVTVVRADTGNNNASSTQAGIIYTGNAYAVANVLNIANTNFINSNYLMYILNNFGNMSGDIVLPTAAALAEFLNSHNDDLSHALTTLSSSNQNSAEVNNTVTTNASSGNNINTVTGTSSVGFIQTGDSQSGANVLNNINQNYIGGNAIGLSFHIFGNWSGTSFNVPEGFRYETTPTGITFFSESPSINHSLNTTAVNSASNNTAVINNSVLVDALTGGNNVLGKDGVIKTGDAYAAANIVNMANTNVLGRNWVQAIINIFGDWSGNVSFGQPNLWIGTRANFTEGAGPGTYITMYYTIKNYGNAPAHDISLKHESASTYLFFTDEEQYGIWNVGDLEPGQTKEVSRIIHVTSDIPRGDTVILNTVTVKATETDADTSDNTDLINLSVRGQEPSMGFVNNWPVTEGMPASFEISKTNNAPSWIKASSTVDYTIKLKNQGSKADHAVVHDEIKSETGEIIHSEDWDLGQVNSEEEITLTYTAQFKDTASPGWYINTAQVISVNGTFPNSAIASSSVYIAVPAPLVKNTQAKKLALTPINKIHKKISPLLPQNQILSSTTSTSTLTEIKNSQNKKYSLLAGVLGAGISYTPWLLLLFLVALVVYYIYKRRKYN